LHLLVRETRTLDDEQEAVDLGHAPADVVFLSFSDSDLGAAASAWLAMGADRPMLRLAPLASLRHPMSVDLYAEQVIAQSRCVVVRLLGGLDYWRYGAEEFSALCLDRGIALALLPGDARDDARLAALSTVPGPVLVTLRAYLDHGGPQNLGQALLLAAQLGGSGDGPTQAPLPLPNAGALCIGAGGDGRDKPGHDGGGGTRVMAGPVPAIPTTTDAAIVFYRSHLLAGDISPIEALAEALRARGLTVRALYVSSLKDPEAAALVAAQLRGWRPSIVLNATGFSARQGDTGSPLDAAGMPVLQLVLSSAPRTAWEASSRGLSATDLAMQVVLPELDGRLLTAPIGFKTEAPPVPGLNFSRKMFRPDPDGIAMAADQAVGWTRLVITPRSDRRIGLILSDYPASGGGQIGHAVGLDSLASVQAITRQLHIAGYDVAGGVADQLIHAEPSPILELSDYRRCFATLPDEIKVRVTAAWGDPSDDSALHDGAFAIAHVRAGNLIVAIQPDRGNRLDRKASYHDPDVPPRHLYVAFYIWLRQALGIRALIHLGTHGTLEWLPGKAVALSRDCFPAALIAGLPVIYPFIVNNPGEAAAAKRRLGAVTIGHLTPPLKAAGTHGAATELERLIDEFAAADGLDRRRTAILRREILERAAASGLLAESGVAEDEPEDAALARLDAYLCDVKELQIRDGLHVFGQPPDAERRTSTLAALHAANPTVAREDLGASLDGSAPAEIAALLVALDGKFVAPGPAGAPTRGRADVLPTGRNLYTVDPRAIPTRSAVVLAERAAEELLRRHRQDHGDWPRSLVLDLWGSATMRTGGEDFALALVLLGARPLWDEGSARVTGIEIIPLALLDRPRVDVTLRISGLFRDAFEAQVQLFDAAVRTIAARDEDAGWNPLAAASRGLRGAALRRATTRIFGAAPGAYGAGVADLFERGAWQRRGDLGAAYLAGSAYAYGQQLDGAPDAAGFAARIAAADGFVHQQDHRETDLLESSEYAAHEGGFAAAAGSLGGQPALYHLDTSLPETPRARTVAEELRRVVRGRAANPAWIAGMMRHGYRGASEIARAVDALFGFAATLPERLDAQFDLVFDATLGDASVDQFLRTANPAARAALLARFQEAARRGLWQNRRNTVAAILQGDAG
jgi:cobaltochelatase CobN